MRPLACLIGRHEWTSRVEQGERYKVCARCGQEPRGPRGATGYGRKDDQGGYPSGGEGAGGDGDGQAALIMAKRWRCYVGQHRWVVEVRDLQKYAVCHDCGKERFLDTFNPPPTPGTHDFGNYGDQDRGVGEGGGGQATLIMAKRWRCYVRLHRWVVRWRDEHGEQNRYIVCRDCGTERDLGPIDVPPGAYFQDGRGPTGHLALTTGLREDPVVGGYRFRLYAEDGDDLGVREFSEPNWKAGDTVALRDKVHRVFE